MMIQARRLNRNPSWRSHPRNENLPSQRKRESHLPPSLLPKRPKIQQL